MNLRYLPTTAGYVFCRGAVFIIVVYGGRAACSRSAACRHFAARHWLCEEESGKRSPLTHILVLCFSQEKPLLRLRPVGQRTDLRRQ